MIEATSLGIHYRGTPSPQVKDVSVRFEHGVMAMLGKNGAGKTSLIRSIVGLLEPSAGTISRFGEEQAARRASKEHLSRIGYLPQDFGYVPTFTAREFVEYAGWLKGLSPQRAQVETTLSLDLVGMMDSASTRMGQLSGGMRRRVGIAQAIVHGPELLVLDEPTTGLDPEQRVKFRELLRAIQSERAVILSSHLIEDVRALASRILILEQGKLVFDGSTQDLENKGSSGGRGDSALERGYMSVIGGDAVE